MFKSWFRSNEKKLEEEIVELKATIHSQTEVIKGLREQVEELTKFKPVETDQKVNEKFAKLNEVFNAIVQPIVEEPTLVEEPIAVVEEEMTLQEFANEPRVEESTLVEEPTSVEEVVEANEDHVEELRLPEETSEETSVSETTTDEEEVVKPKKKKSKK